MRHACAPERGPNGEARVLAGSESGALGHGMIRRGLGGARQGGELSGAARTVRAQAEGRGMPRTRIKAAGGHGLEAQSSISTPSSGRSRGRRSSS